MLASAVSDPFHFLVGAHGTNAQGIAILTSMSCGLIKNVWDMFGYTFGAPFVKCLEET